jgi:hypothetical protein
MLLADLGCGIWSDMPYNQYNYTNLPDEDTYRNAIPFITQETYAIYLYDGINDLKNHVLNGNAAVIGINVYSNFDNIENYNNTYCLNDVYGNMRGGHAVTICGFDDGRGTSDGEGAFKLSNSWGPSFGEAGYFWMSYEAVQSSLLCHGWAYYAEDRIDYEPILISTFNISHDFRFAVDLLCGIGGNENPQWKKKFFDWYMPGKASLPFPSINVVVDLTDGVEHLEQPSINKVFMRAKDRRFFWHQSTEHAYSGYSYWCADEEIPGYDNGWLMFLDTPEIALGSNGGTFTFMLSYAIEDTGNSQDYDGWDGANIRISTVNQNAAGVILVNGASGYALVSLVPVALRLTSGLRYC